MIELDFSEHGYVTESISSTIQKLFLHSICDSIDARGHPTLAQSILSKDNLEISESLSRISDFQWRESFGHLAYRILPLKCSVAFLSEIENILETVDGFQECRLHEVRKEDLKLNPNLSPDQKSLYFRLVRCGKPEDIGFAHRDSDFWVTGIDDLPILNDSERRIKAWHGVFGVSEINTLRFIRGSHKESPPFTYISKDKKSKPIVDNKYLTHRKDKDYGPYKKSPFVNLFHDKVVHYAPLDRDLLTSPLRISVECTVLISSLSSIFD